MTYGNGVYFGAGWDRDNNSADVDVFSLNGEDWYPFTPGTTNDRLGATFFKNTIITVGENGEIRQSGVISPPPVVFSLREVDVYSQIGAKDEWVHRFLGTPGQQRILEYTHDLKDTWQVYGLVEPGPLGLFEVKFHGERAVNPDWRKRMFFRMNVSR